MYFHMAPTNQIISSREHQSNIARNERFDNVKFVICNLCFWCTSLLYDADVRVFDRCPYCRSNLIEAMSIEPDKEYAFHRKEISNVIMEFHSAQVAGKESKVPR